MFRNTKQHYKFISSVPADFTEVLWNVKAKSRNRLKTTTKKAEAAFKC